MKDCHLFHLVFIYFLSAVGVIPTKHCQEHYHRDPFLYYMGFIVPEKLGTKEDPIHHIHKVPSELRRWCQIPEAEVTGSYELLCGF